MMEWKLIETAPKDGRIILVSRVGGAVRMAYWCTGHDLPRWQPAFTQFSSDHPTHWMPLPEPPR